MPKFQFNKLVRDDIVALQQQEGYKVEASRLSGSALISSLLEKIHEETDEVGEAVLTGKLDQILPELADLAELLTALTAALGVTAVQAEAARARKAQKTGAFDLGVYISTIEIPEGNNWIAYYRGQPEKYPEILPPE